MDGLDASTPALAQRLRAMLPAACGGTSCSARTMLALAHGLQEARRGQLKEQTVVELATTRNLLRALVELEPRLSVPWVLLADVGHMMFLKVCHWQAPRACARASLPKGSPPNAHLGTHALLAYRMALSIEPESALIRAQCDGFKAYMQCPGLRQARARLLFVVGLRRGVVVLLQNLMTIIGSTAHNYLQLTPLTRVVPNIVRTRGRRGHLEPDRFRAEIEAVRRQVKAPLAGRPWAISSASERALPRAAPDAPPWAPAKLRQSRVGIAVSGFWGPALRPDCFMNSVAVSGRRRGLHCARPPTQVTERRRRRSGGSPRRAAAGAPTWPLHVAAVGRALGARERGGRRGGRRHGRVPRADGARAP